MHEPHIMVGNNRFHGKSLTCDLFNKSVSHLMKIKLLTDMRSNKRQLRN